MTNKERTNGICMMLHNWFPQFEFHPIVAGMGWCSIKGVFNDDLSPLTDMGIEPETEKDWARDYVTWSFWITPKVIEKIRERIIKEK